MVVLHVLAPAEIGGLDRAAVERARARLTQYDAEAWIDRYTSPYDSVKHPSARLRGAPYE